LEFIKLLRPEAILLIYPPWIIIINQIKKNNDDIASVALQELKQQSFRRAATHRETGFIAQEVEQAANKTGFNFSGVDKPTNDKALYGLRYSDFVVPLVKAVQEQQQIIETLQKQVEAAKAEIPIQIGKQQVIIERTEQKDRNALERNTTDQ